MDKIFSARVDESLIRQVSSMAHELRTTKKAIVEAAIRCYADAVAQEKRIDILEQTLGAWRRNERPQETVQRSRTAFQQSMNRHHR
jgi:predicted transcriptional regulator